MCIAGDDLKGKVVIVTGATGYIGSSLVDELVGLSAKVVRVSRKKIPQKKFVDDWVMDLENSDSWKKIVNNADVIFHLAALIAIPYSYIAPNSYVDTNINGTLNICQAAKENGNIRVIHTSTSEVYGTAQYVPIDENHPMQAQSPYSATKIASDAMAMSFYNSFDLPVTIARPFNTYGPRQSARAVIPTIITQIANGAKEIKLGDVTPTRDFNYVDDTCRGFIALSKCNDSIGETVNIGSNFEISIGDTLNLIKELMDSDVEFITDNERLRPSKSEVFRLWCDNSKMEGLTGFKPEIGIREGLQKTIDWIIRPDNLNNYKSDIYNV